MTRGDIKLRTPIDPAFTQLWVVDLGTTTQLEAGEPGFTDDAAAASPYTGELSVGSDGNGTTSERFGGICKSDSDETAAAAGEVTTWMPLPGIIYSAKCKLTTDMDTAAEVKTHHGKRVPFDLTGVVWTLDTAAADAVANCCTIVGGDYRIPEVYFVYRFSGTYLNFSISA